MQNISETYLRNIYIFLLHGIRTDIRKYCQRNLEKKCDMYMIIIKIDCCGRPQMSSDAMQFERLDVLRCYVGERVKIGIDPIVCVYKHNGCVPSHYFLEIEVVSLGFLLTVPKLVI